MEPSKATSHMNNESGFTLIEVMIAITILSFIAFSTVQMVDSNVRNKEIVVKEDRQTLQVLTVAGRLESDISQMYNPLYSTSKTMVTPNTASSDVYADNSSGANGPFEGKAKNGELIPQFKSEDKSSIIFFTQANRRKIADSKESRFAWIKYSLRNMEPDPDNPDDKSAGLYELVRQTISNDIYNSTLDWTKPKFQVVMERVKTAEFSFWDEKTKKFTSSLQDLNENKNLIRSIKVNITWVDDDNKEQKIERAFRVLYPYFNTKQDDMKSGAGAYGGGAVPPNIPDSGFPDAGGGNVQF